MTTIDERPTGRLAGGLCGLDAHRAGEQGDATAATGSERLPGGDVSGCEQWVDYAAEGVVECRVERIDAVADLVEGLDDEVASVLIETLGHLFCSEPNRHQSIDHACVTLGIFRPDGIVQIAGDVRDSRVGDNQVLVQPEACTSRRLKGQRLG